jgi:tRNA(Ile)-lysidine synthase TilS/MesJ
MQICTTCVLPETFPGITFDAEGRCCYCTRSPGAERQNKARGRYREKFRGILNEHAGKNSYDALVAYSGGKDSTYTLKLLKEDYALKILAITFDHGFVSPAATKNIRQVTEVLDIDHLTIRPGTKTIRHLFVKSLSPGIYPIKSLERASSICNSCMNIVKSFLLKTAIEMRVPLIAYGWSPGQAPVQSSVFKLNASMLRQMQTAMRKPLNKIVGDRLSSFFLEESHYKEQSGRSNGFPYLIHPLAFLQYSEEHILTKIKGMGWVDPKDTDSNSTNCLLNGYANQIHINQYGFHPYACEIAGLVREGYLKREEGLKRLAIPPDPKIIRHVKEKLGVGS